MKLVSTRNPDCRAEGVGVGVGVGGVPSPAGLGSRAQCLTQTKYRVSISSPRHALPAGSKPTLFQVQEQLGHAGRCVLMPALGLGPSTALSLSQLAEWRVDCLRDRKACGSPLRLFGVVGSPEFG